MSLQDFYNSKIRTPEEFVKKSIGDLYCWYNFDGGSRSSNSARLFDIWDYKANRSGGTLYLVFGKTPILVDEHNIWSVALENLETIYKEKKNKDKREVSVTAHITTALGWTEREPSRRAYFEFGNESVFCDSGREFNDLCAALNLPIINDDEED